MTLDKFMHDRDAAILWARKLFEHGEFVILDTETTGLDSASEIIQLGITDHEGNTRFNATIKPSERAEMDDRAFAVHGIRIEGLQDHPNIAEHTDSIVTAIKGKTVIAWNASFDYRMLIQSFNAWRIEPPSIIHLANFECAMLQYAKFYGDWDTNRGQYRWQKLPNAVHGALADCRATLAVLQQMAETPLSTENEVAPVEPPATPEPEPAPIRTIAFEHGHGSVTQGPPPESTSTTVEVELHDDGTDPAANGYTFNLFEAAAPGATDEQMSEYYGNLAHLLNEVGATSITVEHVAAWSTTQLIAAATWAAKTATAQIDLSLNGHGEFPTWPEFFPAGEIPF